MYADDIGTIYSADIRSVYFRKKFMLLAAIDIIHFQELAFGMHCTVIIRLVNSLFSYFTNFSRGICLQISK